MENLAWLIWIEASYRQYLEKLPTSFKALKAPSRIAWFNMLYGPHVGEH